MLATTVHHRIAPMAHCASICPHQNGVLISYYTGPECTDRQQLHVEYWERGQRLGRLEFPEKTGNAVLIPMRPNQAVLVYSMFEDKNSDKTPASPVDRWSFCSLWKTKIRFSNKRLKSIEHSPYVSTVSLGIEPTIGLLPRCNPIRVNKTWYLPLYQEHDCHGVIVKSDNGWDWTVSGKIGENVQILSGRFGRGVLMQPTIWHENNRFHTLCRDVSPARAAWFSTSEDGQNWIPPVPSIYENSNNSIHVQTIKNKKPIVIWNNGIGRSSLVLGRLWEKQAGRPHAPLRLNSLIAKAAYPNSCIDYDGRLHIVNTEGPHIAHHTLDQDALDVILDSKTTKIPEDYDFWIFTEYE